MDSDVDGGTASYLRIPVLNISSDALESLDDEENG